MYGVDREKLVELAGIEFDFNQAYTPVTVGKKNLVTIPKKTWAGQFSNLNFTNTEELRNLAPENVSMKQCFYQKADGSFDAIEDRFAVVGDESGNPYSIHSGRYEPVQHRVIIDAMADAVENTNINVFGHFDEDKGKFNGYGTFANPNCHINLGVKNGFEDPVMLGMRFFNSHNGDSRFGGEIFGIRAVCQNYMAWGETLGHVRIKHFKSEENVADELSKILTHYMDRVDTLKNRIHVAQDESITLDEQECLLWGINIVPYQIENILTHRNELNPEMIGSKGSVWDIYNASTAYVTYHVGGEHTVGMNLELSEKIEAILTTDTQRLISKGAEKRADYLEALDRKAQKTRIVVNA